MKDADTRMIKISRYNDIIIVRYMYCMNGSMRGHALRMLMILDLRRRCKRNSLSMPTDCQAFINRLLPPPFHPGMRSMGQDRYRKRCVDALGLGSWELSEVGVERGIKRHILEIEKNGGGEGTSYLRPPGPGS
jgi:hypothetical protein